MSKERVIPFKVDYFDLTGNHLSALVLVQLEYWQPKAFNGWISKTEDEWKDELRITYKMLQRIQADLVNLGFIQVKQMHFKGKKTTHYRVDAGAVKAAIEALNTDIESTKGQVNQRVNQPKVKLTKGKDTKLTKGKDRNLPKGNLGIDKRSTLYTESTTESTAESTLKVAETSSAQLPLFNLPLVEEKKATTKSPKQPKEKAPPAPPKHLHFQEFKKSYLDWYEKKFGMAHTFKPKDAGILSNLIDSLKQITKSDEATALITFQAMLTNWDELKPYNRSKPQLNLILANLNSICTELKDAYETELHSQRWGR